MNFLQIFLFFRQEIGKKFNLKWARNWQEIEFESCKLEYQEILVHVNQQNVIYENNFPFEICIILVRAFTSVLLVCKI